MLLLFLAAGGLGWWWTQEREIETTQASGEVAAGLAGRGEVLLEARPWGRIVKALDTATGEAVSLPNGSPFTPRLLQLPAGSFEVTISHSDSGTSTCRVEVSAGERRTCEVRFFETEPRAYFKEMGW